MKVKTKYVCQSCGCELPKYMGKCPECGEWGSFVEEKETVQKSSGAVILPAGEALLLKDTVLSDNVRFQTGISEFDRVTGGGLVDASVSLLAGDPGTGKSTLVLQIAEAFSKNGKKILYVCAEESPSQVKLRAQRLGISGENLYLCAQTETSQVKNNIEKISPDLLIIDSIQSVYSSEITSGAGSVSQIRECTNVFTGIAKSKNITTVIIGHVTKDGAVAGPRVLEHMVDTVLYFEGDKSKSFRILRSIKNRFGCTNEIGIFEMKDTGLVEVNNPGEIFLKSGKAENAPGTVITAACDGSRVLILEVQALVGATSYPSPRRVAVGFDYGRLLQIIAVIEKRIGINLSKSDVYINIAGGFEVDEPSIDSGVAAAIISSARDIVMPSDTVIAGEISLSGDIGLVRNAEKLITEAQKTGFKRIILPAGNVSDDKTRQIKVAKVERLSDILCLTVPERQV